MRYVIAGKIYAILQREQISASFVRRKVVIKTESKEPQKIEIEFTQDSTNKLSEFYEGDIVKVEFALKGREWSDPRGNTKYFNSIHGIDIYKV